MIIFLHDCFTWNFLSFELKNKIFTRYGCTLSELYQVYFQSFYHRPQRPYWPPLGGLHCPLLAPRFPPLPPRLPTLVPPRGGPPWCPDPWWCPDPRAGPYPRPEPRPLWVGGSWPESHSGVVGGTGLGGDVCGWLFAALFFFAGAGAGTGTTDSSLALLF